MLGSKLCKTQVQILELVVWDSDFLLFKNLLRDDLVIINVNKYASKINIPLRKNLDCPDKTSALLNINPHINRKIAMLFSTRFDWFGKKLNSKDINIPKQLKNALK